MGCARDVDDATTSRIPSQVTSSETAEDHMDQMDGPDKSDAGAGTATETEKSPGRGSGVARAGSENPFTAMVPQSSLFSFFPSTSLPSTSHFEDVRMEEKAPELPVRPAEFWSYRSEEIQGPRTVYIRVRIIDIYIPMSFDDDRFRLKYYTEICWHENTIRKKNETPLYEIRREDGTDRSKLKTRKVGDIDFTELDPSEIDWKNMWDPQVFIKNQRVRTQITEWKDTRFDMKKWKTFKLPMACCMSITEAEFDSSFEFSEFPYDKQELQLIFGSHHDTKDIKLRENTLYPSRISDKEFADNTHNHWRLRDVVLDHERYIRLWESACRKPLFCLARVCNLCRWDKESPHSTSRTRSEATRSQRRKSATQAAIVRTMPLIEKMPSDRFDVVWEYEAGYPSCHQPNVRWLAFPDKFQKELEKSWLEFKPTDDPEGGKFKALNNSNVKDLNGCGPPHGCFFNSDHAAIHSGKGSSTHYFVDFETLWECNRSRCIFFWRHNLDTGAVRQIRRVIKNSDVSPPSVSELLDLEGRFGFRRPEFEIGETQIRPVMEFLIHLERIPHNHVKKIIYMTNMIVVFAATSFFLPGTWVTGETLLGTRIEIVGACLLSVIALQVSTTTSDIPAFTRLDMLTLLASGFLFILAIIHILIIGFLGNETLSLVPYADFADGYDDDTLWASILWTGSGNSSSITEEDVHQVIKDWNNTLFFVWLALWELCVVYVSKGLYDFGQYFWWSEDNQDRRPDIDDLRKLNAGKPSWDLKDYKLYSRSEFYGRYKDDSFNNSNKRWATAGVVKAVVELNFDRLNTDQVSEYLEKLFAGPLLEHREVGDEAYNQEDGGGGRGGRGRGGGGTPAGAGATAVVARSPGGRQSAGRRQGVGGDHEEEPKDDRPVPSSAQLRSRKEKSAPPAM